MSLMEVIPWILTENNMLTFSWRLHLGLCLYVKKVLCSSDLSNITISSLLHEPSTPAELLSLPVPKHSHIQAFVRVFTLHPPSTHIHTPPPSLRALPHVKSYCPSLLPPPFREHPLFLIQHPVSRRCPVCRPVWAVAVGPAK